MSNQENQKYPKYSNPVNTVVLVGYLFELKAFAFGDDQMFRGNLSQEVSKLEQEGGEWKAVKKQSHNIKLIGFTEEEAHFIQRNKVVICGELDTYYNKDKKKESVNVIVKKQLFNHYIAPVSTNDEANELAASLMLQNLPYKQKQLLRSIESLEHFFEKRELDIETEEDVYEPPADFDGLVDDEGNKIDLPF